MTASTLSLKDRTMTVVMRSVAATHRTLLRASAGRVGRRWFGGEVLLLTVRGRRSGRTFTVPLMFVRDGEDLVVAASNGGVDREPQWWLNLQHSPHAEVEIADKTLNVTASQVDDTQRAAMWARLCQAYRGFAGYQAGVQRQIAVVRLRPADQSTASEVTRAATRVR